MRHILRSTLILSFFFGLAKLLSFIRQVVIARQFGLSGAMDAFNAANNYPDLLAALISGGALAIAFIPVLTEYLQQGGRPKAWILFSQIINLTFFFAAGVSLFLAVIAGPLVSWKFGIAPGFNPSQQALVVKLMRLDLIGTMIFSISGLVMASLQANQHFWLPAMAPTLYTLGQLLGAFVLAPSVGLRFGPITLPAFGLGVYGLVYGVILGAALHLLIQVPGLIKYGFRWSPILSFRDPGVRRVLSLLWPSLLAMFFFQLNFVARDNLASQLGEGAVTVLTYSWTLMQLPETLIGTAIATVLLPTLAGQIARNERTQYKETLNKILRVLIALTVPVMVILVVSLPPLIRVVFAFKVTDTELFVNTARAFLGGIVGYSLVETGVRAFYAQQKPRFPLFTSLLRMLVFVFLGLLLFRRLGPTGLSLADSLVAIGEGCLLFALLNRTSPGVLKIGGTLLRVGLATCAAGLVSYALIHFLPLADLPLALVTIGVGGFIVLPFILPEIMLLIRL
jgi:putative peptidoglycan lipid II flippase